MKGELDGNVMTYGATMGDPANDSGALQAAADYPYKDGSGVSPHPCLDEPTHFSCVATSTLLDP